ncbi:hypothetical protein STIAU_7694 [Stigmatella aurantiaca DW4/3-1]|uniref:Uncharacterized protein n=1 Tax=Stigmatella aurantiaca (strain DW4/3-1) TaxID=378806 RepID=Q08R81_STIAD|nr:hypothetical protein STIAU_7694 [Stigmatella aurantiaca DW4/3-1]
MQVLGLEGVQRLAGADIQGRQRLRGHRALAGTAQPLHPGEDQQARREQPQQHPHQEPGADGNLGGRLIVEQLRAFRVRALRQRGGHLHLQALHLDDLVGRRGVQLEAERGQLDRPQREGGQLHPEGGGGALGPILALARLLQHLELFQFLGHGQLEALVLGVGEDEFVGERLAQHHLRGQDAPGHVPGRQLRAHAPIPGTAPLHHLGGEGLKIRALLEARGAATGGQPSEQQHEDEEPAHAASLRARARKNCASALPWSLPPRSSTWSSSSFLNRRCRSRRCAFMARANRPRTRGSAVSTTKRSPVSGSSISTRPSLGNSTSRGSAMTTGTRSCLRPTSRSGFS